MFNILVSRISRTTKDMKQKDILSISYVIWISITFLVGMSSAFDITLKPLVPYLKYSIINLYYIIEGLINSKKEILQYSFIPTYYNFVLEITWVVKVFIITFIPILGRLIFRKIDFQSEITLIVLSLVTTIFVYKAYFLSIFIFVFLLLLIQLIPIGSGKYLNLLECLKYLNQVIVNYFELNPIKITSNLVWKLFLKSIMICLLNIIISIVIVKAFSVPLILALLFTNAFTLLVFLNRSTENKVYFLIKKFILFVLFLVIVIYANLTIENNIAKMLVLFMTLYFSLDRILALSNEVSKLIKSDSILYYGFMSIV